MTQQMEVVGSKVEIDWIQPAFWELAEGHDQAEHRPFRTLHSSIVGLVVPIQRVRKNPV